MPDVFAFNKDDLLLGIVALFLPPLPVIIRRGPRKDFWINILLVFLMGFPAILHSIYVVYTSSREYPATRSNAEQDLEAQVSLVQPEPSKKPQQAVEVTNAVQDVLPPAYDQVHAGGAAAHAATDNKIQH